MKKVKFAIVFIFMILSVGLRAAALPTTPSGLKACWVYSSDHYEIHLSWNENPEAKLIGYNVYRSLAGGSESYCYLNLNRSDGIDNDLDGDIDEDNELVMATWYEDEFPDLSRERTYYYRVTAVVSGYSESIWSEPADSGEPMNPPPSSFGCFIATAAYGNAQAQEVQLLQKFRDRFLIGNLPGKLLVQMYYKTSPPAAQILEKHPALRYIVRKQLSVISSLCRLVL